MNSVRRGRLICNDVHGEDAAASTSANGFTLAVVADGISNSGAGRVASRVVVRNVLRVFQETYGRASNAPGRFDVFIERLWHVLDRGASTSGVPNGADSTLSAVVVEPPVHHEMTGSWTTAHYIALGDSPILLCCPRDIALLQTRSELDYLCHAIHDRPMVIDDEGLVYSWVDVTARRVRGQPRLGSVRMQAGETLLVMTDGLAAFDHIIRDVATAAPFAFLQLLESEGCSAALKWLRQRVKQDQPHDDASLVVLHLPKTPSQACRLPRLL